MPFTSDLTTAPVPELIRRIAVPASVGFFFHTMYNVVDTFFGGLISTQALAALSLAFPVFFILIALGNGLATGATALTANALGSGDEEQARRYALQGVAFGVTASAALAVFGTSVSPFLFSLLGASGEYLDMAVAYMSTIFGGSVFFMLVYMLNSVLNALGETRPFRNFLILGFFLNIVLDPWLIYGGLGVPALGFEGIALATVLTQVTGCFYLGFRAHKTGLLRWERASDALPQWGPFKEIARQGLPASLNVLTVGLGIFVITYFISGFGREVVAAYGIATRIEQMVLLPALGLNVATLTLSAQNNGARRFDRIAETLATVLRYGAWLMGGGALVVFFLAPWVMTLFTSDARVVGSGVTYLRIDAFLLFGYVVLFCHVSALQGMKRPMFAIWIGLFRQIAAPALVFHLATQVLDWGVTGVWWGIFFINWTAAGITVFYARRVLARIEGSGEARSESQ